MVLPGNWDYAPPKPHAEGPMTRQEIEAFFEGRRQAWLTRDAVAPELATISQLSRGDDGEGAGTLSEGRA